MKNAEFWLYCKRTDRCETRTIEPFTAQTGTFYATFTKGGLGGVRAASPAPEPAMENCRHHLEGADSERMGRVARERFRSSFAFSAKSACPCARLWGANENEREQNPELHEQDARRAQGSKQGQSRLALPRCGWLVAFPFQADFAAEHAEQEGEIRGSEDGAEHPPDQADFQSVFGRRRVVDGE
jgi:hypothetical protein